MNRTFLAWTRTIHIYLTMASLGVMLFFALTGIAIVHEGWLGITDPHTRTETGQTPADIVGGVDKLKVVEHLRAAFHVTGAVDDFGIADDEIRVRFVGFGYEALAVIGRPSGHTEVKFETKGLAARLNDLHRARGTGATWWWLVDASAVVIVLACATGVVLWLALPKRRKLGILWLVLGTGASVGFYMTVVR